MSQLLKSYSIHEVSYANRKLLDHIWEIFHSVMAWVRCPSIRTHERPMGKASMLGLGFETLFGLCMALLMKVVMISLTFHGKRKFLSNVRLHMPEFEFRLENETEDYPIFVAGSGAVFQQDQFHCPAYAIG